MNNRPHLILFNPDQWRGDVLGHAGNPAACTPHLDQIVAGEAVSFRNAFCQNPVCTPSRCSFMSGWYPHVRGHRTMFHMLRPDEPVLLRDLKEAGYYVWWGGKNDLIPGQGSSEAYCSLRYQPRRDPKRPMHPNLHGWEEWRGEPGGDNYYSFLAGKIETYAGEPFAYDEDWAVVEGAIEAIQNRPKDQPLCLYLALNYPHPPFAVEEPWYSRIPRSAIPARIPTPEDWQGKPSLLQGIYRRQGLQGWSEERWREMQAVYYGMCARVDHQFGLLVQALKEAGIYEDTAIFFFADHGEFAGNYGLVEKSQNTFEDCLTNVPFIIKPPAGTPLRPGVRQALVELTDLRATVEALTGLEPGYTHFGRSLLPVIAGETEEHRRAVFCEGGRLHGERHCMELGSASASDPHGLYWPRVNLQTSAGPEHTKAVMCRTRGYKYVRRLYESDELYDLQADPMELHNRIHDPALKDTLAALKEQMLDFFLETGDAVPWQEDER